MLGSRIRVSGLGFRDLGFGILVSDFGYRAGREFKIEHPSLLHFSARLHDVSGGLGHVAIFPRNSVK